MLMYEILLVLEPLYLLTPKRSGGAGRGAGVRIPSWPLQDILSRPGFCA